MLHVAASIVGASCGPPATKSRHALVCFTLADYLIELYRETFRYDLSPINCAPSWTVPVPGRHMLDTHAVVAYADLKPDYTRRPDPKRLLLLLSAMKNSLLTDRRQR